MVAHSRCWELYCHPQVRTRLHPFHVSVVEINHNETDKTLEISCKIFIDDFEKVLAQNYKVKVDPYQSAGQKVHGFSGKKIYSFPFFSFS
jgi:hypothetical protein